MANLPITFFCPACGIKLTVPASLAGVTGPCPSCRNQIQAPIPAVPIQAAPIPTQVPVAPASYAPPVSEQQVPPLVIPLPQRQMVEQPAPSQSTAAPVVLKPEPRQLPNRPHVADVVAKQMPEPTASSDPKRMQPAPLPRHPHKTGIFARFAWSLLFVIASAALVYGVITVLKMRPDIKGPAVPKHQAAAEETHAVPSPPTKKEQPVPSLPTPAPEQPTLIEPVPELPSGVEPKSPGMEALAVLEKFVNAKSLAERLPIIETKTPEAELATSCLASPLPPAPKMLLEFQESNPLEEVVDFYYNVDFEMPDKRPNLQTILVRTRGGNAPKVVVDPFLDLFGGRLAAYASKPSDKAGVFQVIVAALASCNDPLIPDREKKLTLKLLSRDNTKEIAQAYFGKMSKIHEMLEDGTYSLSYGKAKSCTVMLGWNTTDNPEHPFLEAIALKALDWNP